MIAPYRPTITILLQPCATLSALTERGYSFSVDDIRDVSGEARRAKREAGEHVDRCCVVARNGRAGPEPSIRPDGQFT